MHVNAVIVYKYVTNVKRFKECFFSFLLNIDMFIVMLFNESLYRQ